MTSDIEMFLQSWTGGGQVPEAERERLVQRLEVDAAFREECVAEMRMLGMLKAVQSPPPRWLDLNDMLGLSGTAAESADAADFPRAVMARVPGQPPAARRIPGLVRRPLAAAAIGIVVGILCTSAVLGFVASPAGRATTLIRDGFEEPPAPAVTGVPVAPDCGAATTPRWSAGGRA